MAQVRPPVPGQPSRPQAQMNSPGFPHPHPHPPQMQPPPQMIQPRIDPAMQAVIEADFRPVDLIVGGQNASQALCATHSLEKCLDCGLDFVNLNRVSKILVTNPNIRCPPPPKVIQQKLTDAVTHTKEEGNAYYKMSKHKEAISRYTLAASIAVQRPPWEEGRLMREELSTVISNRSAAYFEAGDFIGALVDAETVISIRRNWSKGHYRKAKALVGLGQIEEAKEAVVLGLQFEPENIELNGYLSELTATLNEIKKRKEEDRTRALHAFTELPVNSVLSG